SLRRNIAHTLNFSGKRPITQTTAAFFRGMRRRAKVTAGSPNAYLREKEWLNVISHQYKYILADRAE
ncbi:MAG: hypothetical protein KGL61_14750, partial [Burkholderiales bacterium]|nr:hypothetical protein [Burkholderiales bacterium]